MDMDIQIKHGCKEKAVASRKLQRNESGVVLIVVALMIAVLSFVAGTTIKTIKPEVEGAGHYKQERIAFYQAEAGIRYVADRISLDIQAGNLWLTNAVENVSYPAPAGYSFDTVTTIHQMEDGDSYRYTVTGRCVNAMAVIEVTVGRPSALAAGAFGNVELQLQPNIELYSYDSTITANPQPANSTGEATAGSNENITVRPGVVLDGVFLLGEDELGFGPSPIAGYENQEVGRIEPDPLGVNTGVLADAFTFYSDPVNNDNAAAGISDNEIDLGSNESMTLPSGHYYLDDIYLGSGSTLTLDGTREDPVVFYVTGGVDLKPNSDITLTTGRPTDFFLFSNSSQDIKLYPNNNFQGFVYAPNGYIDLHPNNIARGVFYGKDLLILPGAESFIDTALLGSINAPYVEINQWRHVLD